MTLLNSATQDYVRQHVGDDVRQLALRGTKDPEVDLTMALQQIQGKQTARHKLPSWAATEGIVFPPHLNMEQCSSEQTARYKLNLAQRLMTSGDNPAPACQLATERLQVGASAEMGTQESSLVDLTGGFGIDFTLMAQAFDEALYVERNEALVALVSHNLPLLGVHHARTVCCDSVATLNSLTHATLIYLDPARRDSHGGRTYAIADCTPDVLQLRNELLAKSAHVLLKLSPMLDWRKAVSDLGRQHVSEVHIVSVSNECKELLLVLQQEAPSLTLFCVNDDQCFVVSERLQSLEIPESPGTPETPETALPPMGGKREATFLYEPNASVMKAGCFDELSARFTVSQVAPNSHLFVSSEAVEGFPGKQFRIEAVTTMNKRDLRKALQGLERADITTRNFPLSAPQLRQRLKLGEGGPAHIFATTLSDGSHVLILANPF